MQPSIKSLCNGNGVSLEGEVLDSQEKVSETTDMISVKQLPIIYERLAAAKRELTQKTDSALALPCTKDTLQAIKTVRAELNATFAEYERQRKLAKAQVFAPWTEFETAYKEYIANVLRPTDLALKNKIDSVESDLKAQKETMLSAYFHEYAETLSLQWVELADAQIAITMSASEKSLKQKARDFLDHVHGDMEALRSLPDSDEILVEYKRSFSLAKATSTVAARKNEIALARQQRTQAAEQDTNAKNAVAAVDAAIASYQLAAPVRLTEPPNIPQQNEKQYVTTFSVTGTMKELCALKKYLEKEGIEYEQK